MPPFLFYILISKVLYKLQIYLFYEKSISTFLKHPTKDSANRSANPPVTRASTILFNSMQEMYQHELKLKNTRKYHITHMAGTEVQQQLNWKIF